MTSRILRPAACTAALALVPFLSLPAAAQLAVSANDGKAILVNGVNSTAPNPIPDNVSIIDLNVSPPKVIGEVQAPASVVGPPQSVAVAPDESIALVTGAMKVDPSDPKKVVPNDKLSVIDLKASPPVVIATLDVGLGASGLSINHAGTLALVANRSEGTVSILSISGKTVTVAGKLDLGNKSAGPSHVVFMPDDKRALLTRDGDHRISVLSVDGTKVEDTKQFMVASYRPYSISISPKGDVAVLTNQGGGQGDSDVISVVDLKQNPPRVVDHVTVGQIPEGATISPDGNFVAITIQNGSARPTTHQAYNDYGLLKIFRIDGTKLTLAAESKVGGWNQGAVWSKDGKTLLNQSMKELSIDVLSFDGTSLRQVGTIKTNGGPAGLRTAEK